MTHHLLTPLSGQLIPVSRIPDPVFAEEMMGPAFAIEPLADANETLIVSPLSGVIKHIAQTGHSVIIGTDDGADIMLHIGVDTVHLKGQGFQTHASAMQRITAGDPLISYHVANVRAKVPSVALIVILTNPETFTWQYQTELDQAVQVGTPLPITLSNKG